MAVRTEGQGTAGVACETQAEERIVQVALLGKLHEERSGCRKNEQNSSREET